MSSFASKTHSKLSQFRSSRAAALENYSSQFQKFSSTAMKEFNTYDNVYHWSHSQAKKFLALTKDCPHTSLAVAHDLRQVYASSASVYGNHHPSVNPLSLYAVSKLQVDYWVLENLNRFSLVQGFRYFNVYGENEGKKGDQASPLYRFNKQAQEHGYIKIFKGSEDFVRDFIWVEDVVDIVLNNSLGSGIFDLGTGISVSFMDIAVEIGKKYQADIIEIDFPNELKSQYQFDTHCVNNWKQHQFMTVNQYISRL